MLSEILKKRFAEGKTLEIQARGIIGYVYSPDDDYRMTSFETLAATIDLIPELLCDQTKPYQAISQLWFDHEVKTLSARVGWDFFPETAAEFVWRLLGRMSNSIPDGFTLQQIERWYLEAEDIPFCDPDPPVCSGIA